MALGSSAPEILLSIIEILFNDFQVGKLGASTIVGSAAFNLMVISAVCMVAIPQGEVRRVSQIQVFSITSFSSIFAYIWLLIILSGITPDVVDLWEALITFMGFPILCVIAYFADKGYFDKNVIKKKKQYLTGVTVAGAKMLKPTEVAGLLKGVGVKKMSQAEALRQAVFNVQRTQVKSRAQYRIDALRKMQGKKGLFETQPKSHKAEEDNAIYISVGALKIRATEEMGKAAVTVTRLGSEDVACSVDFKTKTGTATKEDFEHKEGVITFAKGETVKEEIIKIVDDDIDEDDEEFYFLISNPQSTKKSAPAKIVEEKCTIVITGDAIGGKLEWNEKNVEVVESVGEAAITIIRKDGCKGNIKVRVTSKEGSAKAGTDFQAIDEYVTLRDNELEKSVMVKVVDDEQLEKNETFTLVLSQIEGEGATLGDVTEVTVTIVNDDEYKKIVERVASKLDSTLSSFKLHNAHVKDQMKEAITPPEDRNPKNLVLYILSLPFGLLFSLIPPPAMGGGWPCFVVSLAFIGLITAFIGDFAGLLGCTLGLKDSVTAITIVALGTSLPDTFASKSAAIADEDADASLGNITGSNSVNVFLGLGLPWFIAACYWEGKDSPFEVPGGDLGVSVGIFSALAVTTIGTLFARRKLSGAELGGKYSKETAVFFVFLWFLYVLMSALKAYEHY